MANLLREMMADRKAGGLTGVASYCTANSLVIEALLQQGTRFDDGILIEATANQVNQFGGYTGMQPADFRDFVHEICHRVGFDTSRLVLGGDHLGPLTWIDEPEEAAMAKAEELVRLYVSAGYLKIHLDTSMRLADDPVDQPLTDQTIARRGARLYRACEEAYQDLLAEDPTAERPVFIIGSEVPIPGGAQEEEDSIAVTSPDAVAATLQAYREEFAAVGMADAFENVIGVVTQPGVEFGDNEVFHYNRENAADLTAAVRRIDGIVLEGHSTDYQSPVGLKKMCEDGIAILKVGPALTFALRAGLFALSRVEEQLIPAERCTDFPQVMEDLMLADPSKWKTYYQGTEDELATKRKYSLSDRCRYYFAQPEIDEAIQKLLANIDSVEIPMGLMHQYLPTQYARVRDGRLARDARSLLLDFVVDFAEDYNYATRPGYKPVSEYV